MRNSKWFLMTFLAMMVQMAAERDVLASQQNYQDACFSESYLQPATPLTGEVDLLFVMDASASMNNKRSKVARAISSFMAQLPATADVRVAVMLAAGDVNPKTKVRNAWNGKLFSYKGNQVFDLKTRSLSEVSASLEDMVLHVPEGPRWQQSEEGVLSFMNGISKNRGRLAENRKSGFFRKTAALAVVFVSDENDICNPAANFSQAKVGFSNAIEKDQRAIDCPKGITPTDIQQAIKGIAGPKAFLLGAVVHTNKNFKAKNRQDSYGWGYMDAVLATGGVSVDIELADYSNGLGSVGKLAASKLNLILDRVLSNKDVDESSIRVLVDGTSVAFSFNAAMNEVHLTSGGGPLSRVEINYCRLPDPGPTPTPTPSPTPSSSPTPEPSPSPSPSPTVEPTPEPSPTPSVEPTPQPSPTPSAEPTPEPSPSPTVEPSPNPEPTEGPPPCQGIECGPLGQ